MNSYVSSSNNIVEFNSAYASNQSAIKELKAEEKWAGWQTLLFILATCGVFWATIFLSFRALFF